LVCFLSGLKKPDVSRQDIGGWFHLTKGWEVSNLEERLFLNQEDENYGSSLLIG
jgi:hypothetical protein